MNRALFEEGPQKSKPSFDIRTINSSILRYFIVLIFLGSFLCVVPGMAQDVVITKSCAPDPIPVGIESTIFYTIDFTNIDPLDDAFDITVRDPLPAGAVFIPSMSSPECAPMGGRADCTTPFLIASGSGSFTIAIALTPAVVGAIMNTASVEFSGIVPPPIIGMPSSCTITAFEPGEPVLTIEKTCFPGVIPIGAESTLMYTIDLSNIGDADAFDITLTDVLPPGTVFIPGLSSPECVPGGLPGTIECFLDTLPDGAADEFIISISVEPIGASSIINTATVSFFGFLDVIPLIAGPSACTVVAPAPLPPPPPELTPDVRMGKLCSPAMISVGTESILIFTIELDNIGDSEALSVAVSDPLPEGATFLPELSSPECGLVDSSGIVECFLDTLAEGAQSSLTIAVSIIATEVGMIPNIAGSTFENILGEEFIGSSSGCSVETVGSDLDDLLNGIFEGNTRFIREDAVFVENENVLDFTTVNLTVTGSSSFTGTFDAAWLPDVLITGEGSTNLITFSGSFIGVCPGIISGTLTLFPPNELVVQGLGEDCKGKYDFFTDEGTPLIRVGTQGNIGIISGSGGNVFAGGGCSVAPSNHYSNPVSLILFLFIPAFILVRRSLKKWID